VRCFLTAILLLPLLLAGCASKAAPESDWPSAANPKLRTTDEVPPRPREGMHITSGDQVVATVAGYPITVEQLVQPMAEAYGVQFLVLLAQLEVARHHAREAGISLSAQDIQREREIVLQDMFKSAIVTDGLRLSEEEKREYFQRESQRLLLEALRRTGKSEAEFDLGVQTTAYLRRLAESQLDINAIEEEELRKAFDIQYGARVRVRHIECANMIEWAEARRRAEAGEPFAQVASELSRNEVTRGLGGLLPPFSASEARYPRQFVEAAFALSREGELSGPVSDGNAFHLIQLVERIAPANVRYEDVREKVREDYYASRRTARMGRLWEQVMMQARDSLRILEPALQRRFEELEARARTLAGGTHSEIQARIEQDRPATLPAQPPAAPENSAQPGPGEVARPPATRPGS